METLAAGPRQSAAVSHTQNQSVAETNDDYFQQFSMNAIASAAISSTPSTTMDSMFTTDYSDNTSTQPIQVPNTQHRNSTRTDIGKLTLEDNSLHDSYSTSVSANIRPSFRRSHTCGSLFAKCGCSNPSPFDTLIFNDTLTSPADQVHTTFEKVSDGFHPGDTVRLHQEQRPSDQSDHIPEKRSNHKSTYVHPDIAFVFTDENRSPHAESAISRHDRSTTITTKNGGKLQLRGHQRQSSPNIGNYTIVDVAIHPEVVLKLSASASRQKCRPLKTSLSEDSDYTRCFTKRPTLERSENQYSGSTDSDSIPIETLNASRPTSPLQSVVKQSEISTRADFAQRNDKDSDVVDTICSTKDELNNLNVVQNNDKEPYITLDRRSSQYSQTLSANQKKAVVTTLSSEVAETITTTGSASTTTAVVDPAQKFFQESGILGPLANSSVSLIRKTSKIMQDSNVIEHIRKNSKLLRQGGVCKDELEYTRSLIPTIKIDAEKTDKQEKMRQLEDEVTHLRDIIKSRDNEIYKLKREIHKLKSVLQQTTNHMSIGIDDLLSGNLQSGHHHDGGKSITTTLTYQTNRTTDSADCANIRNANFIDCKDNCQHCQHTSPATNASVCSGNDEPGITSGANYHSKQMTLERLETNNNNMDGVPRALGNGNSGGTAGSNNKGNNTLQPQHAAVKKQGVSGESSDPTNQQSNSVPIPKFKKDFRSKQLIKDAIMDNDFLKNIDSSQVRELVESMHSLDVAKGEYVIREGEVGAHLYVSAEGEFQVMKNGKVLGVMGPGKAFGELAILYNCTRTASIRCMKNARVWVLDRRVFQQIMMRTGMQRIEDSVNFLKSVPLLKNLSNEVLAKIADVLEVEFYPAGTYIIRQGASGDTFFLISQGTVKVTQRLTPNGEEKEIRTLNRGDYFGEQALINEDKRTANIIAMAPGVECLTLDRESFTHLIGDLCELKEKNYGDENRVLAMKFAETSKDIFGTNVKQEMQDVELDDLEVVATLGIGGFGRVELVKCYRQNRVETYALKCLKKKHILDTRQEEHVFSERTIMLSCNTPFICRLYRTFKDSKYVYMMLEACMGGEVWTILRDRGSFDETTAQFIIGCVLQAFEYMHSRGIIYRDLKPENLMLDERGYVKLVDFGFAKYIGQSSKTWTFCGTPEYVAPEIILNKGHDRAVDYWALGILIHELLNGTPPFTANDPMKTYNIILKGIDMVDFPKHMSRSAVMLIKRLCRDVPVERLGYQKGGIQDIKKHKWFQGFDWDGLDSLLLIPPFVRPVSHSLDTSYFDSFPPDMEVPPDEISGWDEDF